MIVHANRYGGYSAYGAADPCADKGWEEWCDCRYGSNPDLRLKCKTKPWSCCPFGICPPWANPNGPVGQACRGLPKEGSGFLTDAAYTVQSGLSIVSLVDKLAVPMQQKGLIAKEAEVAAQSAQLEQQRAQLVRSAEVRHAVGTWVKYGALAAGGLLTVIVVSKALARRRRAASGSAPAKPKLKLVRRAA